MRWMPCHEERDWLTAVDSERPSGSMEMVCSHRTPWRPAGLGRKEETSQLTAALMAVMRSQMMVVRMRNVRRRAGRERELVVVREVLKAMRAAKPRLNQRSRRNSGMDLRAWRVKARRSAGVRVKVTDMGGEFSGMGGGSQGWWGGVGGGRVA